jgi:hypothetical protein
MILYSGHKSDRHKFGTEKIIPDDWKYGVCPIHRKEDMTICYNYIAQSHCYVQHTDLWQIVYM